MVGTVFVDQLRVFDYVRHEPLHDLFAEPDGEPLYTLDVVWDRRPKRRGRDELGGLGDFRDLQRFLAREVAR